MTIKPYSAIKRYLGWWVVMQKDGRSSIICGQIVETGDLASTVQASNGNRFSVANSALLEPRIAQLHPTEPSTQQEIGQ